jgi:hypothetical protein
VSAADPLRAGRPELRPVGGPSYGSSAENVSQLFESPLSWEVETRALDKRTHVRLQCEPMFDSRLILGVVPLAIPLAVLGAARPSSGAAPETRSVVRPGEMRQPGHAPVLP